MIEKMSKLTVVCLSGDRLAAVDRLAELGVLHVVDVAAPQSAELERLHGAHEQARQAEATLAACRPPAAAKLSAPPPSGLAAAELVEQVLRTREAVQQAEEEARSWRQAIEQLEPWGSFARQSVERLATAGYQVRLCAVNERQIPAVLPDGCVLRCVNRRQKIAYLAVVAPADLELGPEWPPAPLPEITDLNELRRRLAACEKRIEDGRAALANWTFEADLLTPYLTELAAAVAQTSAHDGMGLSDRVAYLQGYVPQDRLAEVQAVARQAGWGLLHEQADDQDAETPTLLRLPRWLKLSKPIFDFIGILPGYNETDVSGSVLIFLCLFFGIIIGDAAYGVIFMAAALFLKFRLSDKRRQLPINLFLLMSAVTLVWGWLSGTWFAIPGERLPAFMRGLPALTEVSIKDQNVQWFCFLIAAVHLSMARIWQMLLRPRSRAAAGHLGWGLLIWGNFFTAVELIVFKGSFPAFAWWLYGLGVVLVLACGVKWTDAGDVLNLPFNFIGSFVDVLSYIRLFAVGLSSYFIAQSFNNMGMMVYDVSPWLVPVAALVILFGHLLNIALGFMGVLVHGIRLNTLEFSNHMGLTWSGKAFKPLCKAATPVLE